MPGRKSSDYGVKMYGLIDGENKTVTKSINELIDDNWGEGYFKIAASDFTDDVMNETADITLGDAWLPEYTNDTLGNNVIIIRNPEIDILVNESIKKRKLKLDVVDKEVIINSQVAHYRHTRDELPYRLYKKDRIKEWRPRKRIQAANNLPYFRKTIQDLRE